jgi:hypothetical protein
MKMAGHGHVRGPMGRCVVKRMLAAVAVATSTAPLAVLSGPGAAVASAAETVAQAGSWGKAIEVPGLGALNTGGQAQVNSVSCGAARNCAAGGD